MKIVLRNGDELVTITENGDEVVNSGAATADDIALRTQITLNRQNGIEFENQVIEALSHVDGVKNGVPVTVTLGNGRIYHAPGSPWYKRTKINTGKGEISGRMASTISGEPDNFKRKGIIDDV